MTSKLVVVGLRSGKCPSGYGGGATPAARRRCRTQSCRVNQVPETKGVQRLPVSVSLERVSFGGRPKSEGRREQNRTLETPKHTSIYRKLGQKESGSWRSKKVINP